MAQSDRRPRRGGRQEPPGQPEELAHPSEEPGGRAGRVLTEVGWVQDVIVHKASGFVVDGHARVALAIKAGEKVPVVYVELDEREEAVIPRLWIRLRGRETYGCSDRTGSSARMRRRSTR